MSKGVEVEDQMIVKIFDKEEASLTAQDEQ